MNYHKLLLDSRTCLAVVLLTLAGQAGADDSLATNPPREVFASWRQAMAQKKFDLAWNCLTPKMQDALTADLAWTVSQLGGERGQFLVKAHARADEQTLQAEIEQKRKAQPRRPGGPTPQELTQEILSLLKDKRAFFLAAFALLAEGSPAAPAAVPELTMISQGNWARGSYLENPQHREHIDFVKTADGWRIDGQWQELLMRRPTPADYLKPKSLNFATPQAAFDAYAKARLAADWQTAWGCLTPRLQDEAAYEALYEHSRRDPHFDKIYLQAEFQSPGPNATAEEHRRLLLAAIKDKFACYAAARDFLAVRETESIWTKPLTNLTISGDRARGQVAQTLAQIREEAGFAKVEHNQIEQPHYFQKSATGWLLDMPTTAENLPR